MHHNTEEYKTYRYYVYGTESEDTSTIRSISSSFDSHQGRRRSSLYRTPRLSSETSYASYEETVVPRETNTSLLVSIFNYFKCGYCQEDLQPVEEIIKTKKKITFADGTKKHNGKRNNVKIVLTPKINLRNVVQKLEGQVYEEKRKNLPIKIKNNDLSDDNRKIKSYLNGLDYSDIPTTSSDSFGRRNYKLNQTNWEVFKHTGERKYSSSTQNTDASLAVFSTANFNGRITKLLDRSKSVDQDYKKELTLNVNELSNLKKFQSENNIVQA